MIGLTIGMKKIIQHLIFKTILFESSINLMLKKIWIFLMNSIVYLVTLLELIKKYFQTKTLFLW